MGSRRCGELERKEEEEEEEDGFGRAVQPMQGQEGGRGQEIGVRRDWEKEERGGGKGKLSSGLDRTWYSSSTRKDPIVTVHKCQ